jgi:hypothetical protein
MTRDADGWSQARAKLAKIVEDRGATDVATEIGCGRATLWRAVNGHATPAGTTQECIERFLDNQDLEDSATDSHRRFR